MKPDERNIDELLKHALPSAPRDQMEAALDRVHGRLKSDSQPRVVEPDGSSETSRIRSWRPVIRVAAAAAVVVAAVWGAASLRNHGVYAVLEAADGSLYRINDGRRIPVHVGDRIAAQETIRSNDADGAVIALADGSHIELRSMAELSWDHAVDGLAIRLDTGTIIVSAARQSGRRVYVRTKDVSVALNGTTLLVDTAKDGSRVGVIDGEGDVREGKTETKLRPGQQVTTSVTLAPRPLIEGIAWSRNADPYRRILESFARGMAQTAGQLQPLNSASPAPALQGRASAAGPQFEEASIKPCDPDNVPPAPPGARGGGANSFYMSPGRTYVLCMTLATIIRTAYNYGPYEMLNSDTSIGPAGRGLSTGPVYGLGVEDGRRVRGGPDWIRQERYTIEAVAEGASDGAAMSGPMLRALLEKRFRLKAHVETEEAPAFDLIVARSGLKIKPVDMSACEAGPPPDVPAIRIRRTFKDVRNGQKPNCGLGIQANGPNRVLVGGAATLQGLANALGGPLGLGVRVFDKTGIADRFNFVLEVLDETPPERRIVLPDPDNHPETTADVPPAANIFSGIEEQLGLRLVPSKASRPFVVIDQIQRPSAN